MTRLGCALRARRRERAGMALELARDGALVFGDHEGRHLHPERSTRTFRAEVARCRKAIGEDKLPVIPLHDLRHTHATLLLAKGVPGVRAQVEAELVPL